VKYYGFVTFYCRVLSWLYFFSRNCAIGPGRTPGRILTVYGLNDASSVVTANDTVNVLVLWSVEIKNIHNFDETQMTLCHCATKKNKIW